MLMKHALGGRRVPPGARGARWRSSASVRSCPTTRSYYDLHPILGTDRDAHRAVRRRLASCWPICIDREGQLADYALNRSLVSLTLDEFAAHPARRSASPAAPTRPRRSCAAMRGNHLDTLVTDEATAPQRHRHWPRCGVTRLTVCARSALRRLRVGRRPRHLGDRRLDVGRHRRGRRRSRRSRPRSMPA